MASPRNSQWCVCCGAEPTVAFTVERNGILAHYGSCAAHFMQVAGRVRREHPGHGFAVTADPDVQAAVLAELRRADYVVDVQEPVPVRRALGARGVSEVPTVRDEGGQLVVDWPDPKPESFMISAEVFDAFIDRLNAVSDLARAESVWRASEGEGERE